MSTVVEIEYDPILGCIGWKFREQSEDELSKKRKARKDDGKHNVGGF